MDFGLIADSLPLLLKASVLTLQVTALSLVFGVVIGTAVALARLSGIRFLEWLATIYIELIRGTPLLVQILLIYFGLPQLTGQNLSEFTAGVLAFSLNSGAYVAEIVRAGIQGFPEARPRRRSRWDFRTQKRCVTLCCRRLSGAFCRRWSARP
ncbi:amino acid ABC transporter permease [Deinococcus lacus]|uniref:Amino acid ABC transporter permease n=1 Tax=Deinococcus lacus TaxID=392561 RepID=A0ABW1YDC3_9DEIO